MKKAWKILFSDLSENRGPVALFLVFLTLAAGGCAYFFWMEGGFRRQMVSLSEDYMRGASPLLGEKAQWENFNRIVEKWGVPYIITDERGRPTHWRNIPGVGQTEQLTDGELEVLSRHRALFRRRHDAMPVGSLKPGGPVYLLYFGRPEGGGGDPLFRLLTGAILLASCALFFLWIHNRSLMKQAGLWVGFAKETAHQFGTPVSSLLGWHDMMQTILETAPDAVLREKASFILKEMSDDIKKLKSNVLRFSQIGATPVLAENDVNEIVREVVAYFRERLPQGDRRVQIIANYNPLPKARINRDLIVWVLENLLKNSIDAIEKAEGRIEIETSYLEKEDRVRITHSDNGKGVKSEAVNKIFDPGFTTKKRGWGLGLALCKRIVADIHRGKIFLESTRVDRGSTFVIELPVSVDERK